MSERRFLSEAFLSQFTDAVPKNKGILFEVTYLRTYSRWLEEKKRRETWQETCERVVNYNVGLYQGPASHDELVAEAELMYRKMFHLEVLPAGRAMWIGGTRAAEKWGEANFNCAYLNITSIDSFCDVFALLLCGCGVGFSVKKEHTLQLPRFRTDIKVHHTPYKALPKRQRREETEWRTSSASPTEATIEIGDSKEAWVEALRQFLRFHTEDSPIKNVHLVYNSIRPAKERLKTFGGRAAGHKGVLEMFARLSRVIRRTKGNLGSVGAMDVCNLIAKNVVVGGTRRSAQIALGDPDDTLFITSKIGMYRMKKVNGKTKWVPRPSREHRKMSNNSVSFDENPTWEQLAAVFKGIQHNGDPGVFNQKAALARRPGAEGINPCAEILLANFGVCNLATVVVSSHIKTGMLDLKALDESFRLATRIGLRQTNITLSLPHWDEVQKRDRLLGVSMTGFMDAIDQLILQDQSEVCEYLAAWRKAANSEADLYSFEMRVPRPLLVTAVKPEGTASLLPTVSCGMHRGYAPYFIRRISISAMDPIAKALAHIGVPYEEDQTQDESTDNEVRRLKFVFPVKTNAKIPATSEPAKDQLSRYLMFQKHYTDHNTSCTITIGNDEWDDMAKMVYSNWEDIVACAFLGKYEDSHPQLPYQRIDAQRYEELSKNFPDLTKLAEVINMYEQEEYEGDLDEDAQCATGACPIR